MKTKLLSLVLCLVMLLTAIPAFALTASAATTLTNIYEFDGYGEPNTSTAGGDVKSNINFVTGKNIPVAEGDKIYVGPCVATQGYHLRTYDANGAVKDKISVTDANTYVAFENTNLVIMCYTVPAGVGSVTPVGSQMFEECYLVTKNQAFNRDEYLAYWKSKNVDPTIIIGGATPVDAAALTNVYATGGTFAGRADVSGELVSSGSYYCTQGYIPVKAGDIIYFAIANTSQGYHLTLHDANKTGTTTVKDAYLVRYEELGGGYTIYAYRMRSDTGFVRVTVSTPVHEAGIALATVNQPFDGVTYRAWCAAQGKSPDSFIGALDVTDSTSITNLYAAEDTVEGYASAEGVKADDKYVNTPRIEVKEGDTIYMGPYNKSQTAPALATYTTSGDVSGEVKVSELTVAGEFESKQVILAYTVPSGVSYIRVNASVDNKDYMLVTNGQKFDALAYNEWYVGSVADGDNIWNAATGIYGGFANKSSVSTNATYDCTAYIPVKEGDKLYVSALHVPQPTLGATYDANRAGIANLSSANFKTEFLISDNVGMLCYTVPNGVAYVRFIFRAALTEYAFISKNKAPTKAEYMEMFNITVPEIDTTSKLTGKKALFIGDSITFGAGEDGGFYFSWAGRIGAQTGMTVVNNGDSGARISNTGDSGYIFNALASKDKDYDMIVMHGGVNDARYTVPVGVMTAEGTTTFDITTFGGGLENIFTTAKKLYPKADLFYISNFHLDGHNKGSAQDMSAYFDLAAQICEKYGVHYINLYDNEELNDQLVTTTTKYLPDTLHPNGAGYDIITKYIRSELEVFYGGESLLDKETETSAPDTDTSAPDTVPDTPDVTTTTPVSDDPTTTEPSETNGGCGGSVTAFVGVIAVIGIAACMTFKKKED
ncbi:MAG: SGNH/GDSL hydrolase family protein [Clostridia bacterium]|nr:SGNH/GDSL hydrolase family protein [Clostridia bacterium]